MPISRTRIRLQIDVRSRALALDVITANTPELWRGVDVQFELGLFDGEALGDITELDSITVTVKRYADRLGPAVMAKTVAHADMTLDLTAEQWAAGADQHAVVTFTAAETNVDLGQADSGEFWLVVTAITTHTPSRELVLGATHLQIVEDGSGSGETLPPLPSSDYYTKSEGDARYQMAGDISDLADQVAAHETRLDSHDTQMDVVSDSLTDLEEGLADLEGDLGNKIPLAQKGAASGVATLGLDTKVPYTQLPGVTTPGGGYNGLMSPAQATAVADVANKVPLSQKGAINGVATLDSSGKVPAAQLPSISGTSGVLVISLDDAMPDVVATPAYKSVLVIKRNTTFITSPPAPDQYWIWNDGDAGALARWHPICAPTFNPAPVISLTFFTGGTFTAGIWPSSGSAVQAISRYTVDNSDPNGSSATAPVYPNTIVITATDGESWTDGSGTHYRHRIKARTFSPDLVMSAAASVVVSVEADGSFYSYT